LLFSIATLPVSFISTLSLHDALPICPRNHGHVLECAGIPALSPSVSNSATVARPTRFAPNGAARLTTRLEKDNRVVCAEGRRRRDRKSTRLNSSHQIISYAVFCLKKK